MKMKKQTVVVSAIIYLTECMNMNIASKKELAIKRYKALFLGK